MNAIEVQILIMLVALFIFVIFIRRELNDLWTAINLISQAMHQDGEEARQLAERMRKLEDDGK